MKPYYSRAVTWSLLKLDFLEGVAWPESFDQGSSSVIELVRRTSNAMIYSTTGSEKALKKRREEAVVRCKGFRCMAYRDKNGIWRSASDDKELEVLEVILWF